MMHGRSIRSAALAHCGAPLTTSSSRMLFPYLDQLNSKRIILASGSPRRRQLLESLGLKLQVRVSNFPEDLDKSQFAHARDYVLETAHRKCLAVANEVKDADFVIAADTIVVCDDAILEKPTSPADAERMLRMLSGRSHDVYTAVCIACPQLPHVGEQSHCVRFVERTEVTFAALPDEVIRAYVASGEPMDKAGSYGIQGLASALISGIRGCYFNVVGLPVHALCQQLVALLRVLQTPASGAS